MSLETELRKNRDRYEKELHEFLRIPSVSARSEHRDDVHRCAEWLSRRLGELGMDAEVLQTAGHPVVVGEIAEAGTDAPTLLVYGHYDVQPPEPLEEWTTPPFEPAIRDGRLHARGAADDKGQVHIHLKALDAYRATHGELPVNLKFMFEGEEEIGSPNLEPFLHDHADRLACDAVVISDTPMLAPDLPTICVGLRGLVYMEIRLRGPRHDLHSGSYGGAVANPATALTAILGRLKDADGRVTIPGFYDAVVEASPAERKTLSKIPFTEQDFRREAAVPALGDGEAGYHFLERIWARPTLDVNGLLAGYTGEGAKTVIPARAMGKVSMRLVPDQDPAAVAAAFEEHVRGMTPEGVEIEIDRHSLGRPWRADPSAHINSAAAAALGAVFGREPLFTREGGSIPIVPLFEELLDAPVLLLGFVLPGCRAHSPDEWLSLDLYHKGIATVARLYDEAAGL
jgi:acetylornithine deacetylase/succinyl-diaminopimelate desuccinylase-like protein